ncbi:MAG: ATP-dependent helicase HrpB [Byssovorax sp.]
MIPLPIDPLLPDLCRALRDARSLVLEAPPGAGKTTRVPRALLDAGFADKGEILVLEPRRLAARLSARRVAEELGEKPGETIGYQMRFEELRSDKTRVRFVTEGILTRRLLGDPTLDGVSAVLLDEFHERHLDGDLALALLRRLQLGPRPDLCLVAMSATLDAAPVAAFLGDAPRLSSEGRRFEVTIDHLPEPDDRPLESQVASALRRLLDEGLDGDVLVFLPGALEIRRAMESCAALGKKADLLLLPLHGSLSIAEQDRAVKQADQRKVIFSTNVAETSVTIDGVVAVIDTGLARIATHAPWSGLPTLRLAKIARASATQRAGRAGRTRPGRCLRLYTKGDLASRPEHETPEIARADLCETVLSLVSAGVRDPASFTWLLAPPTAAVEAAVTLLLRLGAIDDDRRLTTIGRRMLRFPVHPRLGRMLVEAERRGIAADGAALAALVSERDLGSATRARSDARHGSDVLALLERYDEAVAADLAPERLRWMGLDPARAAGVARVDKQLARLVDKRLAPAPPSLAAREEAQLIAILAGYPDRVGRLRRPANATGRTGREIVFATGGTAALAESSGVADVDLVVAVDAEERSEQLPGRAGGTGGGLRGPRTTVRLASEVEADWLLDLFTDRIRDTTVTMWNDVAERVEVKRQLVYEGLVLEESRVKDGDPHLVAKELAEAVRKKGGFRAFVKGDELDDFLARLAFARRACPEVTLPELDEAHIDLALADLCEGSTSFADLREKNLAQAIRARLSAEQARLLAEIAPETITLPGGRKLRLDYPAGEAPRAESRLQDFFGMKQGPRVAKGRVPVVLSLNAPNQRAVQVTTDLEGFWSKHYPAIAKELRRRYPKHSWPDDPLTARPPEPRGPRR